MINRRHLMLSAFACVLSPAAMSAQSVFAEDGVAIRGYDPVAYFTEGRPLRGDPAHAANWGGVSWHFASAESRAAFIANPEAFAPQYGGFCAWAVAEGYTAPIDPQAWAVVEGRLYLNFSRHIQARWARDVPGNITRADANWPGLRN